MALAAPTLAHADPAPDPGGHTSNGRLVTAEQVAARWQVKTAQVYRLAREGRLPTVRLGRYRRWRERGLERFEREGGTHG